MTKKTLNLLLVVAAMLAAVSYGCDADGDDSSGCAPDARVDTTSVLLEPEGPTFTLTGDPGKKDCHAIFLLTYRWADPERARNDSTTPPPLNWTFQTHPGMFYFPTPDAVRKQDDEGWYWEATNDIGAKNQDEAYVEYEIEAYAPDFASEAILIKSASIEYAAYD